MADPTLIDGRGVAGGVAQPVVVMNQTLPVSGGGGGSGDASAANQTTEITKLTSIDGKTPTLGTATAANSQPVTLATDGVFVTNVGGLTEAAPASDTASSGLNGRLQRVAQRLSTMIGLLPTAIGQAVKSASLAIVPASDWTVPAAEVRTATLQNAAAATGNGTPIDVSGMAAVVLGNTVAGSVGTVTPEVSPDSTNGTDGTWFGIAGENIATGLSALTFSTAVASGYTYRVVGWKMFRARISAYTSGAITVIGRAQANDAQQPVTPVSIYSPGTLTGASVASPVDGIALNSSLSTLAIQYAWNGTNADRARNNNDLTLLASAARTVTTNSPDQTNYNGRSLRVDIDVTAVVGSPSLVFKIQTKDALSGVYVDVLTAAAITATGHVVLLYGSGVTAVANLAATGVLGRTWRVVCTAGTADSVTYSVSASVVL